MGPVGGTPGIYLNSTNSLNNIKCLMCASRCSGDMIVNERHRQDPVVMETSKSSLFRNIKIRMGGIYVKIPSAKDTGGAKAMARLAKYLPCKGEGLI